MFAQAISSWAVIRYWTVSERWSDLHRLALCFGATAVAMVCGFSGSNKWPRIDLTAKIILNIVAVLIFFVSAKRLHKNHAIFQATEPMNSL